MTQPFATPSRLSPDLARVRAYWKGLLRGGATMPFADDAKLTDLPDLMPRLFMIEAFERPERFRFALLGRELSSELLEGRFLDEIHPAAPLDFLRAQCSAAVEARAPTHHRGGDYARLLLPLWGDGRVSLLLGAVDRA